MTNKNGFNFSEKELTAENLADYYKQHPSNTKPVGLLKELTEYLQQRRDLVNLGLLKATQDNPELGVMLDKKTVVSMHLHNTQIMVPMTLAIGDISYNLLTVFSAYPFAMEVMGCKKTEPINKE